MKKHNIIILFIAYVWTKTLLGLVIHPFQSVREVSRNRVLVPVVFSPLIGLCVLLVLGRIGVMLFEVQGFKREILAFVLSSALISIVLWQGFLLYLLGSFYLVFRKTK